MVRESCGVTVFVEVLEEVVVDVRVLVLVGVGVDVYVLVGVRDLVQVFVGVQDLDLVFVGVCVLVRVGVDPKLKRPLLILILCFGTYIFIWAIYL